MDAKYEPPSERLSAAEQQIRYLERNYNKLENRLDGKIAELEERLTKERELRIGYEGKYSGAKAMLLILGGAAGYIASQSREILEWIVGGKVH